MAYISSTIKLGDPMLDSLQFQRETNPIKPSTRLPIDLDSVNDVSYKIKVPNFNELTPLKLSYKYITDLIKIDSMIPTDLYSDEKLNKVNNTVLDSYYYNAKGLGDFTKFDKIQQFNLPDKFFDEYNSSELITKMGLFPEIERSWIIVDNKLILWNYKAPQSSFNKSNQFLTIDQIRHSILSVKLAKPRPGVFVDDVNYILLVATPMDIHIYVVKYKKELNNLEIFDPSLSVSVQGLVVSNFVVSKKGDVFFTEGVNVWRLDYNNKASFIKNKCDKVCLTKSGFGIPSIFEDNSLSQSKTSGTSSKSQGSAATPAQNIAEVITQLEIDDEREILYSLSNKSIIRTYKLKDSQISSSNKITPSEMYRTLSSLFVDAGNFKSFSKFRIMNIQPIFARESSSVQLIAMTNFGVRILLKLGPQSFFQASNRLKLSVVNIKFPPSKELPTMNNELDSFTRSKQYISQLISSQQRSDLLKNTKFSKVLSPGVFLVVKRSRNADKLFVSTVNYGSLKKNNKLIEDAEFLKIDDNTFIHDIVQLTPSMNATNQPNGYANILASQYTKQPLRFAVLTNFGIQIYEFKTPDKILNSLNEEIIENFIDENGFEETCSTLLYLSCSYGHHSSSDLFKRKAQMLFSTCGNNSRLLDVKSNTSTSLLSQKETNDQVILSDRFYGTCLLISRIFRDYWNNNVFLALPNIKMNSLNQVDSSSIKDNLLIKGLSISKKQIEYFMGSIIVLIEFFVENGNNIQGLNAPNYSSDPTRVENEMCLRSEHIAFTSLLKSLDSMKEALSFLMVLIEETESNKSFDEILKFLTPTNQLNLLNLSFKDLLLPNDEVKNLIKDLLSSIINKNILKGGSIDLIASSLQGRCGSFVSTDDVLIFKAIENLTRAKNIGFRDNDLKFKCLKSAVLLFEQAYESLTLENVQNSVNIMLELEYYVGAVELLLKLANKLEKSNKQTDTKLTQLYDLVFNILTKIDMKVVKVTELNDTLKANDIMEVRNSAYDTCFISKDKRFHYEFYEWFIKQGVGERLLDIDSPFILPFLEEKAVNDVKLSELLWSYHAKRENYYNAASILYSLAISEFKLDLVQRIEYLSRANGFCNCTCPPNLRQKMIQLSALVQDLFDVSNIQLDVLSAIKSDNRINQANKQTTIDSLNFKILNLTDLFNDFTDPLGYYDLSLLIFKISDHRNPDDILKRWEYFFEKLFHKFLIGNKTKVPLYVIMSNEFTAIGSKLSSNDLVFPIDKLIKLISKNLHDAMEEDSSQAVPEGALVDMFIKSGVPYDKLYYVMRSLIENDSFEIYPGFVQFLRTNEMVYLIKQWFAKDKNLRNVISNVKIANLTDYTIASDPIGSALK
ncbi:hypothetical protein PSN45_005302 [Yamadazyma tenuis]|uniref:Nucleoporin-domain-containing protein n=1 Tax=Candida tenuis (strain ATCC 10573 / BCRC 21748 / CBS 615 / JCM 9827 / NBRC 10315 / NRRL Y-1498 / VKM Y-70) TaxID=590646 RepID=G3B1D6_CANTC|nr:uncharacterized protein CANTEDRAFT_130107 [Yamadazyma tenuis ATCC 10573]EGV64945.1 hypothetical protein CANTEDRAFT_130107 [Yamadazyma tenuis ATCC 10573]WEJ97743.1 hypothetical protein PSN45_005302 [Yamadazyma tenuis]